MCERCDELAEEVAYLRSELGLVRDSTRLAKLRSALGLSPSEASIVSRLHDLRGKALSRGQLLETLPGYDDSAERGENLISVYVAKIRGKIGKGAILTAWGKGFAISPEGEALVAQAVGEREGGQ